MAAGSVVYRRWLRDRLRSTIAWAAGIVIVVVASAAFYPSFSDASGDALSGGGDAMSTLLGLSNGIDPTSPLGFLWVSLYANILPWMLMALGVALGTASIAIDEDSGTLEFLLARPVTRSAVALARFGGMVTVLLAVSVVSALALIISLPLFDLSQAVATTDSSGSPVTEPAATAGDVVAGTFAAFAVGLSIGGVAYLLGATTGNKNVALGGASAIGIGGYVLYTLSNMTSNLDALTWVSPWRWYIDDAMLINGLDWDVALPFVTALVCLVVGWMVFVRRDIRGA